MATAVSCVTLLCTFKSERESPDLVVNAATRLSADRVDTPSRSPP